MSSRRDCAQEGGRYDAKGEVDAEPAEACARKDIEVGVREAPAVRSSQGAVYVMHAVIHGTYLRTPYPAGFCGAIERSGHERVSS